MTSVRERPGRVRAYCIKVGGGGSSKQCTMLLPPRLHFPTSSGAGGTILTLLTLVGSFAASLAHPTSNIAQNLVGDLVDGFHTHDGLDPHPVSDLHPGFHSHDGLSAHPVNKVHEERPVDALGRRFGFAQGVDYEEYGLWEDEDGMEYGEERSGQDSPFDDPFFKSFRPRKKKGPEQQKQQASSGRPKEPTRAPKTPTREVAPTSQVFSQKKPKVRPAKVVVEKQAEQGGTNSEMIREFTLMISKLLFQLSQMKA